MGETRTFKTTTDVLAVMRTWLIDSGVTNAAIESTSTNSIPTYRRPGFYALEEHMTCWLLNAKHMKAVPGSKTDVKDAE